MCKQTRLGTTAHDKHAVHRQRATASRKERLLPASRIRQALVAARSSKVQTKRAPTAASSGHTPLSSSRLLACRVRVAAGTRTCEECPGLRRGFLDDHDRARARCGQL